MPVRGVDFSNGADLVNGTFKTWALNGIKRLYIQYSEKLPYYLKRAQDYIGLVPETLVDVYVYLYFPRSPWNQLPENRVSAALKIIKDSGTPVRYVWLDVEDPNDSGTDQQYIDALFRCGDLIKAAGYLPGLYTGRSSYISRMGSYKGFALAGWPLWHANYVHGFNVPPEVDLAREPEDMWGNTAPYAGYDKPLVRQWHGTSMFGGHSIDMDIEGDDADHAGPPPAEEDEEDMKFILPEPGEATWWNERHLVTNDEHGQTYSQMRAGVDLHAEPGDVARFAVNLRDGQISFYHGETDLIAGICHEGFNEVEAKVSDNGIIRFKVQIEADVDSVFSLGNWR